MKTIKYVLRVAYAWGIILLMTSIANPSLKGGWIMLIVGGVFVAIGAAGFED